ncbi:hypothetical protein, partial [Haloarcula sp. 1CSR25-25]|uniref:hypothetical protein n=1 Tax=Haloarcula sp. 1CSR25-25 TaxID=2862545 RepID=UPI002893CD0C
DSDRTARRYRPPAGWESRRLQDDANILSITVVYPGSSVSIGDLLTDSVADQFHQDLVDVLRSGTRKRISEVTVSNGEGEEYTFAPRLLPYEFSDLDKQTILGYAVGVTENQQCEYGL